jgi:anti-sigma factor ChrR (cupin superfamily)
MSHTGKEDESRELAALYALGALDKKDADAFEEHLSSCDGCAAEVREFELVGSSLALAPTPAEPPAEARSKLLSRIANEDQHGSGSQPTRPVDFLIVRKNEGEWVETSDKGVSIKVLFVDRGRNTVTTLVRMEPGARIPRHRHRGAEQCIVLEGDVRSGSEEMTAGDFNCSLAGSIHDELISDGGALLFIVAPESYEVLDPHTGIVP